jgi:hypothetical protein
MKRCAPYPDCPAVCHFCIWYEYNGDGWKNRVYCDEGYCRLNGESKDPHHDCLNFVCFNWIAQGINYDAIAEVATRTICFT